MLKVLTVCINGMGSSLLLKMSVQEALKQLGIEAEVKHCNASEYKGQKADMIITTPSLAKTIGQPEDTIMVKTKNFLNVDELKQKISEALEQEKADQNVD